MLDALVGVRQQIRVRVRGAADVGDALRLLGVQLALKPRGKLISMSWPATLMHAAFERIFR